MDRASEQGISVPQPIRSWDEFPRLAFVASSLDVRTALPVELIEGHVLRRATDEELPHIKRYIESRWPIEGTITYEFVREGPAEGKRGPRASWRYFVIEVAESFSGVANSGVQKIEQASELTGLAIECPLFFDTSGHQMLVGQMGANSFNKALMDHIRGSDDVFDDERLAELREVHRQIESLDARHGDVRRAVEMLDRLRGVARGEPLRVLGLFAVIESLITHSPVGGPDSLGHQIKTKMRLLNRRFEVPLDFSQVGGMSPDKAWKKLYECRSTIAHGGDLDFTNSIKPLESIGHIEAFLTSAARSLLRQALIEPDLVLDLRNC